MNRIWSVLFWSVIAAAFIGPGTVTTAASAGAGFRYALLWALAFSTLACLVLQEAAARLTVVSGRDLGRAIRARHARGWRRTAVLALVLGGIVLGCAAYEAGNILGGAAGAVLGAKLDPRGVTLLTGLIAGALLAIGRTVVLTRVLAVLVAVMGATFLFTAWRLAPGLPELARGMLVPRFPGGASLLILGLVGTTVVPYNLFLGSGLARGQKLGELRFGLAVSVVLGGIISMGILVVGAAVVGPFGFDTLTEVLTLRLGPWARSLFGAGLYAAGLSSAVTAPLAAAVTARGLFGEGDDPRWSDRSRRFRAVWGGVLAVGVGFGLAGVRPVPAILIAQALNGVLLPFVAMFLLVAVNDRQLMGPGRVNGRWANRAMIPVVAVTLLLGVSGIVKALAAAAGLAPPGPGWTLVTSILIAIPLARPLLPHLRHIRI